MGICIMHWEQYPLVAPSARCEAQQPGADANNQPIGTVPPWGISDSWGLRLTNKLRDGLQLNAKLSGGRPDDE